MTWPKSYIEWREGPVLNISVPFTWELPAVRTAIQQGRLDAPKRIRVGGPAVRLMPHYLDGLGVEVGGDISGVLQMYNPEATQTTRGCLRSCSFCAVPKTEGRFVELADWPDGWIVCDNNILAASTEHFDRVCDGLERWGKADFNQGLDTRLMNEHHVERMRRIGDVCYRLALDGAGQKDHWERAFSLLRGKGVPKSRIRSYAIVAHTTDPAECWLRCNWIEKHGVKALPMWFHALDCLRHNEVTKHQQELGWSDYERRKIMRWYYKHSKVTA